MAEPGEKVGNIDLFMLWVVILIGGVVVWEGVGGVKEAGGYDGAVSDREVLCV